VVFAFVEDGTLSVYETATDAIRQYEGIDVEDGVVHFYDEKGTYLEPRFSTPNKRGRFSVSSAGYSQASMNWCRTQPVQKICSFWLCTRLRSLNPTNGSVVSRNSEQVFALRELKLNSRVRKPNKRMEYTRIACPTRKSPGLLLAAHSRR
jgi:hypothetical protein